MKDCPKCHQKLDESAIAFCTRCGHQLVTTDDLPTLDLLKKFQSENDRLRTQVTKLKEDFQSTFGGTIEPVEKRVSRAMKVAGFTKEKRGWIAREYDDDKGQIQYYDVYFPGSHGSFSLFRREPQDDDDDPTFLFVAMYNRAVDLENELADVRVLLGDCWEKDVSCGFILATNESLRIYADRVEAAFEEMKTFLPKNKRKYYQLEIWDTEGLLANEYELKIKVKPPDSPQASRRKSRKNK